ncbi:MAG: hypothetical protein JWM88_2752 [Verrucomicrobia bacterium]|nr:hypothetical protein [Verrucomicrobiota bacterium]
MHPRRFPLTGLVFLAMMMAASAPGQTLPSASPFLPPRAGTTAASDAAKYQLGGMIAKGKDVLVSVTRLSDKQSFWIPVGSTVDEVTAISYVSELDEAVISANGEHYTLRLRQSPVQVGGGLSPSLGNAVVAISPPLPPPVGPPEVQEREARMLVTDLLEIGMEHRKAYEAAQKKAAATAAKK